MGPWPRDERPGLNKKPPLRLFSGGFVRPGCELRRPRPLQVVKPDLRWSLAIELRLADPEIFSRFLAAVGDDFVAHLGALVEVAEPSLLHSRNMDKHVLAAGVGLDESEALCCIEPLHGACRQRRHSLFWSKGVV